MKKIAILLLAILVLAGAGAVVYKRIEFKQNCTGRLERAANANSIEIAVKEVDAAIQFAETKGYTSGYTSVFYQTPDEDIEYWYNNLCASRQELANLPDNASTLEKTNTLMKLRETLTNTGEHGAYVIYPKGLEYYPHNFLWGIVRCIIWIAITAVIGAVILIIE